MNGKGTYMPGGAIDRYSVELYIEYIGDYYGSETLRTSVVWLLDSSCRILPLPSIPVLYILSVHV